MGIGELTERHPGQALNDDPYPGLFVNLADSRLRQTGGGLAFLLALTALYSCSLLVETKSQQCQKDEDCAMFSDAKIRTLDDEE